MLQDVLDGISDLEPEVAETAVLLASELAENAVLHAGTEFEVSLELDDTTLTVTVTDRGPGPLEAHLAEPGTATVGRRATAVGSVSSPAWPRRGVRATTPTGGTRCGSRSPAPPPHPRPPRPDRPTTRRAA